MGDHKMNVLTAIFETLTINKPSPRRLLIGFADTEGVPHRKDSNSSLWNLVIIFKYITDENFNQLEECMHVTHFAMPKNLTKATVKKPLMTHIDAINHIKEAHDCNDVVLGFWNAPHDNAVLRYYDALTDFKTVDLLTVARECSGNKFDSYSIGYLAKKFNYQQKEGIHTGLGDTLRMIKILPRVGISGVHKLKPFVNLDKNDAPKPKPKTDVEKKRPTDNDLPSSSEKIKKHTRDNTETKSRNPRRRSDQGLSTTKNSARTTAIRRARENNCAGTKGIGT